MTAASEWLRSFLLTEYNIRAINEIRPLVSSDCIRQANSCTLTGSS